MSESNMPQRHPRADRMEWSKTMSVMDRLQESQGFAPPDERSPYGYYYGRPIIGRDVPIWGGVSLGEEPHEAVVVDEDAELQEVYDNLLKKLKSNFDGDLSKAEIEQVLQEVFSSVVSTIPVDENFKGADFFKPDQLVSLSFFIKRAQQEGKGGVCRHQALLSAYLVEKLIMEGYIRGRVSYDRNTNTVNQTGHGWARFLAEGGNDPFIIDPTLFDKPRRLSSIDPDKNLWYYRRPEE